MKIDHKQTFTNSLTNVCWYEWSIMSDCSADSGHKCSSDAKLPIVTEAKRSQVLVFFFCVGLVRFLSMFCSLLMLIILFLFLYLS